MFCENDFMLIEDKNTVEKNLNDAIYLLKNNKANIIKFRHRINPGEPIYCRPTKQNLNQWMNKNQEDFPYKLESLSWLDNPNQFYNNLFEEFDGNYKWYITTIIHQRWCNNIFLSTTEYLKNIILPLIMCFVNNNDKYLGLEEILVNYNKYININEKINKLIEQYLHTKLASSNGLFMHKDY
jgi:hypothetical protein